MSSSAPTLAAATSLADVERIVGGWCDVTDPACHTGADAVAAVERLARVIRRLTAMQAGFAERVDACRAQPRQAGSPDDWLARQNGTSVGDARRAIDTARRLKSSCPATADAFANGELSLSEADAISGAAAVDPTAERELVEKAKRSHDLADTKEQAAKVKAGARKGEDPEVRRARLRAKRRWSEFTDDEMRAVAARFPPEDFALVAPVIDAYAKPIFDRARTNGVRDPLEAYRADAVLAALAAAGELAGLDIIPRTTRPTETPTPAAASSGPSTTAAPVVGSTATTGTEPAAAGSTGTTRDAAPATGSTGTAAPAVESDDMTATATTVAGSTEPTPTGSTAATPPAAASTGLAETATSDVEPTEPTEPTESIESEPDAELVALLKMRPDRFRVNVSVLIDGIALKRGYATANETCEIVGVGPVDVDWVSRILPQAFVDVLVHDLVDIKAHATMTRHRKKAVEKAVRARDRRCVVPGCKRKRRLQADHRHDFAKGGPTSGANLELLCEQHHAEKTHRGAWIERTDTEWHWYPPPPKPGEPEPPPRSIPWRAPIGEHLTAFDLDDLPPESDPDDLVTAFELDDVPPELDPGGRDDTLPFT